jgi:hypothetical protein
MEKDFGCQPRRDTVEASTKTTMKFRYSNNCTVHLGVPAQGN